LLLPLALGGAEAEEIFIAAHHAEIGKLQGLAIARRQVEPSAGLGPFPPCQAPGDKAIGKLILALGIEPPARQEAIGLRRRPQQGAISREGQQMTTSRIE